MKKQDTNHVEILRRYVTGRLHGPSEAVFKGAFWGALATAIFEMASLVNDMVPRVPVSWLIMAVVPIVETVLLFRIAAILRHPRTEDFLFTIRISHKQRKELALFSFSSVQKIILLFSSSMIAAAAALEFVVMRERMIINLVVVPAVTIGLTAGIGWIGLFLLRNDLIKPVKKDMLDTDRKEMFTASLGAAFRKVVNSISFKIGSIAPVNLKALVIRNFLYLFRKDPFIFLFFTVAAQVFLFFLCLLLGDRSSPFIGLFTVLFAFMLSVRNASLLQDATQKLDECPYYSFDKRDIFGGYVFAFSLLSLLYPVIFAVISWNSLFSTEGILRFVTLLTAIFVSMVISARSVLSSNRKNSDVASDWFLFGTVCIGFFIPFVGWIFPVVALFVVVLLEWESLFRNV
jgi:hypothetical protein